MDTIHKVRQVIIACLIILSLLPWNDAQAGRFQQSSLTVERNEIKLDFPTSLTFHLEINASSEIQNVYLNYGTNGRSCLQGFSRQAIDPVPGTQVTAEWEWDFTQSGSVPPGAEIWWEWEVLLSSGESLLTERKTYTLVDPRFTWRMLEDEGVSVHWTEGTYTFGTKILNIAQNSIERLESEIGIQALDKVTLIIYPYADDIQGAILYLSDWVGGLAIPDYNILLMAIGPTELDWAEEITPHEIAHLVIDMRIFNCMGISLPTWLSEGLATVAEGEQSIEDQQLLGERLTANTLPGLVTLVSGFSADSAEARLSYIQSGAVVQYMLDTYGPEKMDELLGVMQSGKNANPALLQVYGMDTAGLDLAWRASLGFGDGLVQSDKTATPPPTQVPTFALWTAAVALTPTPSETPVPTSTETPTPLPPTATPSEIPATSPVPPESAQGGSPLQCFGGTVGVFLLPGLALAFVSYRRAVRK